MHLMADYQFCTYYATGLTERVNKYNHCDLFPHIFPYFASATSNFDIWVHCNFCVFCIPPPTHTQMRSIHQLNYNTYKPQKPIINNNYTNHIIPDDCRILFHKYHSRESCPNPVLNRLTSLR